MTAITCTRCGYRFNSPISSRRYWWTRAAALIVLLALVTASIWGVRALLAPSNAATLSSPEQVLPQAIQATVQILTPDESQPGVYSAGSGTFVDKQGHILTNFHVVGDPETGKLYNSDGIIYIGVTTAGSNQPPKNRYLAELIEKDEALDLAVLRIVALHDGASLPSQLGIQPLPLGDSDSVQIGDAITLLGYPGLGGDTITLTRGTVSGFLENWIKTDAESNHGNSGGAAINSAGALIGIPSAGNAEAAGSEHLPGKIALIRPINAARPLLARAGIR